MILTLRLLNKKKNKMYALFAGPEPFLTDFLRKLKVQF